MTQKSTAELSLDDAAVLAFLQADPDFFTRHSALLADLTLPNPHGDNVISLSTKQLSVLRAQLDEKSQLLEALIGFGKANDEINTKIHQLSLALLSATDIASLPTILDTHVKQSFDLTHASLHTLDAQAPSLPEPFLSWLQALSKPYCNGPNAAIEALIESKLLSASNGSFSVIPMRTAKSNDVVACIVLAAKTQQHFTTNMETDFLTRIGELFSARLLALDTP